MTVDEKSGGGREVDGGDADESAGIHASCSACEFDQHVEGVDAVFDLQEDHAADTNQRHVLEFDRNTPATRTTAGGDTPQ